MSTAFTLPILFPHSCFGQSGERGQQARGDLEPAAGLQPVGKFQGVGHRLAGGVVVENDVNVRGLDQQLPGPLRQFPQFLRGIQVVIAGLAVRPELEPGFLVPTVAAEVEERAPTVVAEVEERAPTVAAEAAEAARDFSEGVRESGVCSGAAMLVLGAGLMAAVVQRRR